MHGTGNDFVIVDARAGGLALSRRRIVALADRHTGIGCDQFIVLEPGGEGADVFMRIYNPDGLQAGACGNATRCVAVVLAEETGRGRHVVQTAAGQLVCDVAGDAVTVDMGPPRLYWSDVPLTRFSDTLHLPIEGDPSALSMGNPHATVFVADAEAAPVATLGPVLERHAIFAEGANIGFAQVLTPKRIRLRVWERGAGLTRACGSGACAALVNAHRRGLAARQASVMVDGGVLDIHWRVDGRVIMTGPAVTAFHGRVDLTTTPE